MSFWERVRDRFHKPEKSNPFRAEIERFLMKIVSDERFQARIDARNELYVKLENIELSKEQPNEYVIGLRQILEHIDGIVKQVAMPFLRAGDEETYAEIALAWNKYVGLAYSDIDLILRRLNAPNQKAVDQWDLCDKVKSFVDVEMTPFANTIIDVSFRDKDISEKVAALIQPTVPARSQGIDLNAEAERL